MSYIRIRVILYALVVSNLLVLVGCWDTEELELFDLVEEVSKNFYTVLGVVQTSDARTIRHAFRNLSLRLHPDKNDAPDADVRFRQLVAVYEVLRDPVKRKRYDEILKNGLPDWRHPVYYYRRVRKMGLAEMLIILSTIVTIGQYIVAWAAYLEKKYILEEFVTAEKKRLQKKQKKGKLDGDMPDMTIEIPKPSVLNTLPFQTAKLVWVIITCIPFTIKLFFKYCTEKRIVEIYDVSEDEEIEQDICTKGPRRRRNFVIPQIKEDSKSNGSYVLESIENTDFVEDKKPVYGGLWTDDDLTELIRLVNKYPPGTNKKWEKIAETMGRSVGEVTHMAKKVKEDMTVRNEGTEHIVEEHKKVKTRGGKASSLEVVKGKEWSQNQQKALEEALLKYPKQTSERWEKISKTVHGKTKEECILRYKQLHDFIKKKKESES